MALPRQVQNTIKEVEELEKQLSGQGEKLEEPEQPVAEEAEEAPQEPTTEPIEAEKPVDEVSEPVDDKPNDPVIPEAEYKKLEQKYRTLQGMLDKTNADHTAEISKLKAEIEEITSIKEESTKATERLVTDDDERNFGSDLIDLQRRVAKEVAAEFESQLKSLQNENKELKQLVSSTESKVAESSFDTRLKSLVPDFAQVNADQRWIEWLDEVDPVLRAPRRVVAQQAFESGDAEGVAYYVDMFKRDTAPVEPVEPPKQDTKKQELERQVQPSKNASNQTPTSQKGKILTNAQIAGMFKKAAVLSSSGRLDEARKLEAEIDAAYMEGRVVA